MFTRYQLGTARVAGEPKVILQVAEVTVDLQAAWQATASTQAAPPASLMALLEAWPFWRAQLLPFAAHLAELPQPAIPGRLDPANITWLPPLLYPRKLICMGLNYWDHLAEMQISTPPQRPYSFLKPPTTTLVGDGATVTLPPQTHLVDWEAELAIVIGQRVKNVTGAAALACVAGYSIVNDLSARDWLAEPSPVGVDWVLQKAYDGFMPMGPYITPADFVPDPQQLAITLSVNGVTRQDSTTAKMIFGVQAIIEHLAAIMTLEPGDVIATGSPAGVGYAHQPRLALHAGDHMVATVGDLGSLVTDVA